MKWVLMFMSFFPLGLKALDLQAVRKEFHEAVNNKDVAEQFYTAMKRDQHQSALTLAYYGSAQTLMGKHAWNPYKKMTYLKEGLADIGKAVLKSPGNLEIRFLRFSVEHYIPQFLGMSKHLEDDKKAILDLISKEQYGTTDSVLRNNMISFFISSGRFSKAEMVALKRQRIK